MYVWVLRLWNILITTDKHYVEILNILILTVDEMQSSNPKPYENVDRDLKFDRNCVTLMRKLDSGQYGSAYVAAAKGILNPGTITEVFIKTFQGIYLCFLVSYQYVSSFCFVLF